jgi:hypothetical protein
MGGKRKTFIDPETGRKVRVCRDCGVEQDYELNFSVGARNEQGEVTNRAYECKPCAAKRKLELQARRKQDPEWSARHRVAKNRLQRNWRKRNPDKARDARRRYKNGVFADSQRHARWLETRRISYALRAERAGKPVVRHISSAIRVRESLPELPAKPLADLLLKMAESRDSIDQLAEELGFTPRSLFAWKTGERQRVQLDVADQILTNAGLMWWEVWPEEEFPELHEEMAA